MRMINVGCLTELVCDIKEQIQYPKRVWHAVPSDAVCHSLYLWDTFDLQWLFCLHSNGQDLHQIEVCKWAIIYVPEVSYHLTHEQTVLTFSPPVSC